MPDRDYDLWKSREGSAFDQAKEESDNPEAFYAGYKKGRRDGERVQEHAVDNILARKSNEFGAGLVLGFLFGVGVAAGIWFCV